MGIATRASDGRRWKSFQGNRQQTWVEELKHQMESRPKPRYEIEEMVLTPLGMKRIVDKGIRGSTWHYSFWTKGGRFTYSEKQLLPLGDGLLLQNVMKIIAAGG